MTALRTALLCLALLAASGVASAQAVVTVVIDLRELMAGGRFDLVRDRVGLRGAAAPLSWGRTLLAEPDPSTPGLFRATLRLDPTPTQPVAYKFKLERPGAPDTGWEEGPNRQLLVQGGTQTVQRAFGSLSAPVPPQRTGHIERIAPQPSAFVAPREVQVWLPPGYASEHDRRYPVLYMLDGQNVFDDSAAGAEWQLDEHAQRLVQGGEVGPLIVVAVASGAERIAELTAVPDRVGGQLQGGGAARFGRYLVEELQPLINRRYRTRAAPGSTAVGGASLGGTAALWLLLEHPAHFGLGLVVSPSVFWGGDAILRDLAAAPAAPTVWLSVGGREVPTIRDGAQRLRQALAARGRPATFLDDPAGGHDEASWAAQVPALLRFLDAAWAR